MLPIDPIADLAVAAGFDDDPCPIDITYKPLVGQSAKRLHLAGLLPDMLCEIAKSCL
jgi:hypothetical protein